MATDTQTVNPTPGELLKEGNYRRIARGAGRASQQVSRILRGMTGMSFETACRLADAAGVSMDDLRHHWEPLRKKHSATRRRGRKAAKPKTAAAAAADEAVPTFAPTGE